MEAAQREKAEAEAALKSASLASAKEKVAANATKKTASKQADTAPKGAPDANGALVGAMEAWIAALPPKGREKLVAALSKVEEEADEWAVLVASAKADKTKVRAKQREALLEAAANEGWLD